IGGLQSFNFDVNESIDKYNKISDFKINYRELVKSSSYTLSRIESLSDINSEDVTYFQNLLMPGAKKFFHATINWLKENNIEILILFNGRMDYTRAALEAAKELGIPCITHERPLFGHGLILNLNENCSSLKNIHEINIQFKNKALTKKQSHLAAKLLAERFVGKNNLEWKKYNENPNSVSEWPNINSNMKILICPSSKNELLGHPDWNTPWGNNTDALDIMLDNNIIRSEDILVRFHPSWAVSFGKINAKKCSEHYLNWCNRRNIKYIPSESSMNTRDLISISDLVILNGSNTILESGAIGKPTLCLGPSPYTHSGAAIDILSFNDLKSISLEKILCRDKKEIITSTLRYVYSRAYREPLYVNEVVSKTVTECDFYSSDTQNPIEDVINGKFIVNCSSYAESSDEEINIVDSLAKNDNIVFSELSNYPTDSITDFNKINLTRKHIYRLVDWVRNMQAKGV
ncbi:hypothetical protein JZL89_20645, partial [Providencia rettgeri]